MARVLRWGYFVFAIIALAIFASESLFWQDTVLGRPAHDALQIAPAVLALGDLQPATAVPLTFTATNTSSRPVRVIGVQNVCLAWGCLSGENLPLEVPAHGNSEVKLLLKTSGMERISDLVFEGEISLYSDHPRKSVIPLHVRGKVVTSNIGK